MKRQPNLAMLVHRIVFPLFYCFHRFRVYFQQIICCCCFRIWKSRLNENNLSPKGILLEKNSHSDPGRSRSCGESPWSFIFEYFFFSAHNSCLNIHFMSHLRHKKAQHQTHKIQFRNAIKNKNISLFSFSPDIS